MSGGPSGGIGLKSPSPESNLACKLNVPNHKEGAFTDRTAAVPLAWDDHAKYLPNTTQIVSSRCTAAPCGGGNFLGACASFARHDLPARFITSLARP